MPAGAVPNPPWATNSWSATAWEDGSWGAAAAGARYTDAFAGTDGAEIDGRSSDTGGGTWDVLRGTGIIDIQTNRASIVTGNYGIAVIGASGTDQDASVSNSSGTGMRPGVGVRVDNTYAGTSIGPGYWIMRVSSTLVDINAGLTQLKRVTVSYVAGETFYIEIVGTTLIAKRNGTTIYDSTTDTAPSGGDVRTTGYVGILLSTSTLTASVDDFDGGAYVVPSSGSKPFFFSRLLRRRVA